MAQDYLSHNCSISFIRKKGEVVGPAGGETGGPRCLAEALKLPWAAYCRYVYCSSAKRLCQQKNSASRGLFSPILANYNQSLYRLKPANASQKLFFSFFQLFLPSMGLFTRRSGLNWLNIWSVLHKVGP